MTGQHENMEFTAHWAANVERRGQRVDMWACIWRFFDVEGQEWVAGAYIETPHILEARERYG